MRLYDSNLLIYSFQSAYYFLQADLLQPDAYISAISKVEVLGFPSITLPEKAYFERLFSLINVLPVTDAIIEEATLLRQIRKMSLGDSIVAATATLNQFDIYTRNRRDFMWITGINVIDPMP